MIMEVLKGYSIILLLFLESTSSYGRTISDTSNKTDTWGKKRDFDINGWNRYDDIVDQFPKWQSACPQGLWCGVSSRGSSYEGRSIYAFTIGPNQDKPVIWVDALIHGREWLAGSTLLYFIHNMINNYDTDADTKRLVDNYEWILVPVVNPDGYEETHTAQRDWRKNMEPTAVPNCDGTDVNRNFDTDFWSETDPCSSDYTGPDIASSFEAQLLQNEMQGVVLNLHGNGGARWLYSYGDSDGVNCRDASNAANLRRVGTAAISGVMNSGVRPNQDDWVTGSVCRTLGSTSGLSIDYATNNGAEYAFIVELSGAAYGFESPTDDIEPTFRETWAGVVAMVDAIAAKQ